MLTVLLICILSLAPIGAPEIAGDVPFFDKWAHFVMYGFLTAVVWWDMRRKSVSLIMAGVVGFLFPVLLGGLMEICQATLTTYRSGEWMDFLADTVGTVLGLIIGLCIHKMYASKRK